MMNDNLDTTLKTTLKSATVPPHRHGLANDIIAAAKTTAPAFSWQRLWQDVRQPQWLMTATALLLVGILLGYQLNDLTGTAPASASNVAIVDDLLPEEIYTMEAFEEEIWG